MTTATQKLPTISGYGHYSSKSYGVNCLKVNIGNLTLYFSYGTVIAFEALRKPRQVCMNDWGCTTGKHLNWIDGGSKEAKAARLPAENFNAALEATLTKHGLAE